MRASSRRGGFCETDISPCSSIVLMKKPILFATVLVLIAGGVLAYLFLYQKKPPEQVICGRRASLCGVQAAERR